MGDSSFTTNNPTVLKGIQVQPAIVSLQKSAQKHLCSEPLFIESNKMSFGSEIGAITNRSTSMFARLANFEPGSREYEELMYRIQCCIQYQQNEIDKSKGIVSKTFPAEWYQLKPNLVTEEDDEETIAQKEFNQRILVDKKPYFMNYVYPTRGQEYKKYIDTSNRKALFQFNLTLEDLLHKESEGTLTEEESLFLHYYHLLMPCDLSPCVMNQICFAVEDAFKGYVLAQNKQIPFDYTILKSGNTYSQSAYRRVKDLYELYVKIVERAKTAHKTFKKQSNEQHNLELMKIRVNFKQEALKLCSNEEELTDMMIDFCYGTGKSKRFVWDVFGEQIVRNLKAKRGSYSFPVQCEAGESEFKFKGLDFKMVQKPVVRGEDGE